MINLSEVMKTYEVVIKMAFLVFKNFKFSKFLQNDSKNLNFFETIWKVHPTKPEMFSKV